MRFWDSSALLPLLVEEGTSAQMEQLYRDDPAVVTWWSTPVECVSAIARLERDGDLSAKQVRHALARLDSARMMWTEVPAIDDVREQAVRLLRVHALRAADALQLAAALVACSFTPRGFGFVTLDVRQATAAEREGFAMADL